MRFSQKFQQVLATGSRAHILVVTALAFSIFQGCATAKKAAFVENFQQMKRGRYVERFRANARSLTPETLRRVELDQIDTSRIADTPKVSRVEAGQWLKEAMIAELKKRPGCNLATNGAPATSRLSLAITEMNPGSQAARIIAAELGAGHAFVQVEGKLTSVSGEEIAAFVDRRRSSGATGFEDLGGDAGPKLIERMIKGISADAIAELTGTKP